MLALKGVICGNTVIVENDSIEKYNGREVIVTILDSSAQKRRALNSDKYVTPTERGRNTEAYMEEMRNNAFIPTAIIN